MSPPVPSAAAAPGEAEWGSFGPFPGEKGLCSVAHSFCPLVEHRADMPKSCGSGGGCAPSCATNASAAGRPRARGWGKEKRPKSWKSAWNVPPLGEHRCLPPTRQAQTQKAASSPPLPSAGSYSEPGALSDTFPHLEGDDTDTYI